MSFGYQDEPAIHNSLFGSRIFINKDIPAITSFKLSYTAKEGYSDGDHKIEVFSPPVVKMTPDNFFKQTVKSTLGGVRDLEAGTDVVIYGKVHRIHKEHGWCYDACKRCNKMARVSKSTGSRKAYTCDDHGVIYQVVPRFKVILRVIDETGSAPFVVFDTNMSRICNGVSAYDIMNKHGQNTADYFPDDLNVIVGNKYLFKFTYTQHNINSNTQVYTAKSVSDDAELVAHYNAVFADGQVGDDQFKTPDISSAHTGALDAASLNINKFLLETPDNQAQSSTNRSVASSINIGKFLLETPDNQVQTSSNNSVEKSNGSSGSKTINKKRDIIDLDELPDEVEAGGSAKKPLLATVKTEEDE
ncbi:replication factor-A carboxy-terminal domain protein [Artemisia annua]|uniref:Replication factor-A carboxy-terminal domain protein n=1 Tax=Artemisia annua TaxID=35608 RepID=A0A2U1MS95_ARTAN|nr:replication factor-A carboxy-terminal domain protein [Artemisia annua]